MTSGTCDNVFIGMCDFDVFDWSAIPRLMTPQVVTPAMDVVNESRDLVHVRAIV